MNEVWTTTFSFKLMNNVTTHAGANTDEISSEISVNTGEAHRMVSSSNN